MLGQERLRAVPLGPEPPKASRGVLVRGRARRPARRRHGAGGRRGGGGDLRRAAAGGVDRRRRPAGPEELGGVEGRALRLLRRRARPPRALVLDMLQVGTFGADPEPSESVMDGRVQVGERSDVHMHNMALGLHRVVHNHKHSDVYPGGPGREEDRGRGNRARHPGNAGRARRRQCREQCLRHGLRCALGHRPVQDAEKDQTQVQHPGGGGVRGVRGRLPLPVVLLLRGGTDGAAHSRLREVPRQLVLGDGVAAQGVAQR
mmetsp:Transcript_28319/g.63439  ORF Transcript_28319/g.63439 Transcript_28319/m.63439 type:complete len:260 (-) Transcript_28319:120-899(-)